MLFFVFLEVLCPQHWTELVFFEWTWQSVNGCEGGVTHSYCRQ